MNYINDIDRINSMISQMRTFDKITKVDTFYEAQDIYNEAQKLDYFDGMGHAVLFMGVSKYYNGCQDEALKYYNQSLSISKSTNNYKLQMMCLNNISVVFMDRKIYASALYYQLEAMQVKHHLVEKEDYKSQLAASYSNIGLIFFKLNMLKVAEKYLLLGLDTGHGNSHSTFVQRIALNAMTKFYCEIGNYDQAKHIHDQLFESFDNAEEAHGSYLFMSSKAWIEKIQGNIDQAYIYYKIALNLADSNYTSSEYMDIYYDMCVMLNAYQKYKELSEEIGPFEERAKQLNIIYLAEVYMFRYYLEKNDNNISAAMHYLEESNKLSNQMHEENQQMVVNNVVKVVEIQESYQRLLDSVDRDPLTNCFNRRILSKLELHTDDLLTHKRSFAVLMLDIDCFKQYNDHYGHMKGDVVIKEVVNILFGLLNKKSYLIRYGGDEFIMILPGYEAHRARDKAIEMINEIKKANIRHAYSKIADRVTVTIGMKIFDDTFSGLSDCIDAVDVKLYQGKESGRDCVYLEDECIRV